MMKGNLFIISAPSGTGKTSLINALVSAMTNVIVSVSHTTRPVRFGEENGVDYHFVTSEVFAQQVEDNVFLEHANVFGHSYGTSRAWVMDTLNQGIDVILEIDWQGALQVCQLMDTVSIFILPPSRDSLQQRLRHRNQDNEATIAKRLALCAEEVSHYDAYNYLVVNDDFPQTLQQLKSVVTASRLLTPITATVNQALLEELLA